MKRNDLERHLKAHGCREIGGSKHAKWRAPKIRSPPSPVTKTLGQAWRERFAANSMSRLHLIPTEAAPATASPLLEAVLIHPARQLLAGEPQRTAEPYMRETTRADQLVDGASRNVEQLRGLVCIEQGLVKHVRDLALLNFCRPTL